MSQDPEGMSSFGNIPTCGQFVFFSTILEKPKTLPVVMALHHVLQGEPLPVITGF